MVKYSGTTKSNQKTPEQADMDFIANDVLGTKLNFNILVKIIIQ